MEIYQNFITQPNSLVSEQFKEFELMMLGKPYQARKCSIDACDCWGLIVLFYSECLGINVRHYFDYENGLPFANCYENEIAYWTETCSPSKGDMIVAYIGENPVHVGLWWGYDKILHARDKTFVRIDKIRTLIRLSTKLRYFKYAPD